MNVILIISISSILLIDFTKLKKNNSNVLPIYIVIVAIVLLVAIASQYDFLKTSPLEMGINKLLPITEWVEGMFH